MRKLLLMALVPVLVLVLALPATAQEGYDPNNCWAQGMKPGGAYECAPLGTMTSPERGANPNVGDWQLYYDYEYGAWVWYFPPTGEWEWA